ncbi:SDR family oxidoreductase, partial [Nocardioides sp.]|uniref:SDR family NAD(P)-dependent oxidoreductase n=1 Tax=Nocardioides sp. TaxID=35761 RepID=UPI002737291A
RGHAVVLTDIDAAAAAATAAEIGAAAGLAQDVRVEASHAEVAAEAARHGVLTVWFNNAGVGDDGTLAELRSDQVQRLVDVNLLGTLWGMRAALAAFGPEGGEIVNIASLSGHGPVPGLSVYAATKAAVVSLTMSADAETPRGVQVHALCPDGVRTAMVAQMRDDGLAKALVHSGGRLLTAEETAQAAVALLGTNRVVRTLPGWRGGLMRATAVAPHLAAKGVRLFRAQDARAARKQA